MVDLSQRGAQVMGMVLAAAAQHRDLAGPQRPAETELLVT